MFTSILFRELKNVEDGGLSSLEQAHADHTTHGLDQLDVAASDLA